ncbi:MAG: metal ABC transporter ATP-binding protein [Dehalococcoidales bacterium]|nr:metal ABC transporter ATP-binding protein [Dehalococcoidales bacterium]
MGKVMTVAENPELVKLEDVWVYRESVAVLEGINLTIKPRDFLGIIGPNGGGKTTLLKVMLGLINPDRGRVLITGKPPAKARDIIGYIPQHSLFDRDFPINVWDVVLMGRYGRAGLFRGYGEHDRNAAEQALRDVSMLELRSRQVGLLSGGEQQRVFIARALVGEPKLLLLDEPTASVDVNTQAEFYELLEKLKERMSIVLVSHDIGAVSIYVDDIGCLNRRLFYHGTKQIDAETLEKTYGCPIHLVDHHHNIISGEPGKG